jgi:HTH-type transcriptional regulator, sugar sensing transcriptional regulator
MKLVISDVTITMFALNDRISLKPSITTMIVNHPSFAFAMKKVFEAIWNSSITLEEYMLNVTTKSEVQNEKISIDSLSSVSDS